MRCDASVSPSSIRCREILITPSTLGARSQVANKVRNVMRCSLWRRVEEVVSRFLVSPFLDVVAERRIKAVQARFLSVVFV